MAAKGQNMSLTKRDDNKEKKNPCKIKVFYYFFKPSFSARIFLMPFLVIYFLKEKFERINQDKCKWKL